MKKSDADILISEYIKKLFGFSMSKLSKIDEAEELAAEIILQVYGSLLKQDNIGNIDGYIYRIAKNVYARYIDTKNSPNTVDGLEFIPDSNDFTAELINSESYGILRREITYLSKIQRKIIVLYYFQSKKVREISDFLSIPENTIKWHLAGARKELKISMEKTRTTGSLGTQPIRFCCMGHDGYPGSKGDTSDFLAKVITQNIAYAAYHQPRTINEIAQELGVNPIFVEDEVAVLEEYGFMDELPDSKYRTNILIAEPNETMYQILSEINPKYTKLLAEKFFAPVLENITEIPDWLHIPDDDINLLKWCLVCFLSMKLDMQDYKYDKETFSVKRPDGGDYIAHATVDITPDWAIGDAKDGYLYGFCGHMWREHIDNDIWWKSWQLDCYWTDRSGGWKTNKDEAFDKLYFYLKGQLPENISNVESYARLLDRGYLIKTENNYKCNLILCDSHDKWWNYIPDADENTISIVREYAALALKAALYGQPPHMHELIKYYNVGCACSLHTRVMKVLLDMDILKLPSKEQAKGLCTVMFTGE